jgi:L-ascorbate metabolism protein UlaG (beta-lactamase superfamily)
MDGSCIMKTGSVFLTIPSREEIMPVRITWLGHAGVMIESAVTLYIDPWKVGTSLPTADVILVTHDHSDHYSEKDIASLSGPGTRVVCPVRTDAVTDVISPGGSLSLKGITVQAVPAYNIGKAFHPKDKGWVGYLVDIEGKRIYHPGDTDRIPEMKKIEADLAFLPVGGKYTMDSQEAGEASHDMKTRYAVPIHYGDIVGTEQDAEKFSRLCSCSVRILQSGESMELD